MDESVAEDIDILMRELQKIKKRCKPHLSIPQCEELSNNCSTLINLMKKGKKNWSALESYCQPYRDIETEYRKCRILFRENEK